MDSVSETENKSGFAFVDDAIETVPDGADLSVTTGPAVTARLGAVLPAASATDAWLRVRDTD